MTKSFRMTGRCNSPEDNESLTSFLFDAGRSSSPARLPVSSIDICLPPSRNETAIISEPRQFVGSDPAVGFRYNGRRSPGSLRLLSAPLEDCDAIVFLVGVEVGVVVTFGAEVGVTLTSGVAE